MTLAVYTLAGIEGRYARFYPVPRQRRRTLYGCFAEQSTLVVETTPLRQAVRRLP